MPHFNPTQLGDASLDARHISSNFNNFEAARTGFFAFIINDIDGIIKATYKGNADAAGVNDRYSRAQEVIKLNVTQASVPHFSVAVHEFRRGNEQIKFAGVPTFDSGSIQVDDIVGQDTKAVLMAWQALTYDVNTRKGGRMRDYKKNCTLVEYTQDYEKVREWTLYGCFISQLSEDNFDRGNDGPRSIGATIEYDRAEMVMDKVEIVGGTNPAASQSTRP